MSPTKKTPAAGERLPYLLGKLKAPRVLERLEQTAITAREEGWTYEQFLQALLEAEVFARDASGARNRIRHAAFPAHKSLEDFDLIDRLVHHAHIVTLKGKSYRLKERGTAGTPATQIQPAGLRPTT
jgi:DNA replication protein DnaC